MIEWLGRWWRKRQRVIDRDILWPSIKRLADSIELARRAFYAHACMDDAYSDFTTTELQQYVEYYLKMKSTLVFETERDELLTALKALIEYEIYHGGQEIMPEPHRAITTLGGANQETELRCTGCAAEGIARWRNSWKQEFEHDPGCRWVAFVETCKKFGIDLPWRTSK